MPICRECKKEAPFVKAVDRHGNPVTSSLFEICNDCAHYFYEHSPAGRRAKYEAMLKKYWYISPFIIACEHPTGLVLVFLGIPVSLGYALVYLVKYLIGAL